MYTYRRAIPDDVPALARFNIALAAETEDKALDPATVHRGVARLLEQPDFGFYTVAEYDGEVVGCALITYEWSDWRDGLFWWFQSVYVAQPHRGQGVFRGIHGHIIQAAAAEPDVCGFRLYVESHNEAARTTYARLNWQETPYRLYERERG